MKHWNYATIRLELKQTYVTVCSLNTQPKSILKITQFDILSYSVYSKMFRPTPGMVIHCIVIPCSVAGIWASLHPFPIGQWGNTLWAHWAYCTITWCIHAFLRWVEGCCHASHTTGIVWIVAVQQPHGVHACNQNQCTMHLLWQKQACNT